MPATKVVLVEYALITPYGRGIEPIWQGLLSSQTAITEVKRFSTAKLNVHRAGTIPGLQVSESESLCCQMLLPALADHLDRIPSDANHFLATINGEINFLETALLRGIGKPDAAHLKHLLRKVSEFCSLKKPGTVVSTACTSSATALAYGADMIRGNESDCVLVTACDCVSEFIFTGFSSLGALDPEIARPFDKNRQGLSIGEGAGFILLMSETRAKEENRPVLAELAGWGLSSDAYHKTAPKKDGSGLARAISAALKSADITEEKVDCIAAHGTGTPFNDAMELNAFKSVFKSTRPTYSIKGGTGHTMGAAGLIETIIALNAFRENEIPGSVGVSELEPEAFGWIVPSTLKMAHEITLSTNAGFGGVNSALIIRKGDH